MHFRDARMIKLFDAWDAMTRDAPDAETSLPVGQIVTFLTVMLWVNIEGAPAEHRDELREMVLDALEHDPRELAEFAEVDVDWRAEKEPH